MGLGTFLQWAPAYQAAKVTLNGCSALPHHFPSCRNVSSLMLSAAALHLLPEHQQVFRNIGLVPNPVNASRNSHPGDNPPRSHFPGLPISQLFLHSLIGECEHFHLNVIGYKDKYLAKACFPSAFPCLVISGQAPDLVSAARMITCIPGQPSRGPRCPLRLAWFDLAFFS